MTSRITQDPSKGEYPKLMQFEDTTPGITTGMKRVVLFTGEKRGVCVWCNYEDQIGDYSDQWSEVLFTNFHGTVELRNEL